MSDQSAGRWCAECLQHGDHHTDKHFEMTTRAQRRQLGRSRWIHRSEKKRGRRPAVRQPARAEYVAPKETGHRRINEKREAQP